MFKLLKLLALCLVLFTSNINADTQNSIDFTDEEKNYISSNPTLKVQGISTFPPFNFLEDGEQIGYSVDYIKLMEKYVDIKFEFVKNKSFPKTIEMFKNGEIDILPHIAKNQKRAQFIDYTNFNHINYSIGVTVKESLKITDFSNLKDKTIALLDKSFLRTLIKNRYPNQKIKTVMSTKEGILAVANEQADAFVGSIPTMNFYIKENWLNNVKALQIEGIGLPSEVSLPMGVQKGNTILKSILEKINNKIEYSEKLNLKEKWLGEVANRKNVTNLIASEKQYLETKENIKICVLPDWLPFEQIDSEGQHRGIGRDILNIISKKINKEFVLVPTKQWSTSLQNIKDRKCDILPVAMDVPSRREYINFTRPYVSEPFVVATTSDKFFIRDEKDLSDKKIGIVKSYAFIEVLKQKNPSIKIVEVKNTKEGLEKVQSGEIFGYVDIMPTIGYFIQKFGYFDLKIAGKLPYDITLSIASRNDEPLLNSVMQKTLDTIPEEEIRKVVGKWIEIKVQQEFDYTKLVYIVIFFIIVILLVTYRNKKITEQRNELQQIIDNSADGIYIMDLEGNLIDCSNKACQMLGYTKDEMLRLNIVDWEYLYTYDEIQQHLKELKNETVHLKSKHKRKDGTVYDTEIYASKITLLNNERIYASVRDITKEKELNEKILEQKQELETAQEVARIGHYKYYLEENSFVCSAMIDEVFGLEAEEEKTFQSWLSLIHDEDKKRMEKYFTTILQNNEKFDNEYRIINKKTNEIKWVHGLGEFSFDSKGNVIDLYGTIQDVTDRKNNEANLKQALYIFENTHDGIIITDENTNIINANKSFQRVSGYSLEELKKFSLRSLKSEFHNDEFYEKIWQSLYQKGFWTGEITNKSKNNEQYIDLLTITAVYDENENLCNYIGIYTDITKQKKQETLLQKQSRTSALGEMIGNIAHQWRQPLSMISTASTGMKLQLEMDLISKKDSIDILEKINEQSQYLSRTIDDFRGFFKENSSNINEFKAVEAISKVENLTKDALNSNFIKLYHDIDEDIFIKANQNLLIQALINIYNNALDILKTKDTKEKRLLFISVKNEKTKVQISIKDNGGGIDETPIEKVFDPYFTTKHKAQGTGIGLYMTHQIVTKQLKGTIDLTNTTYIHDNKEYKGALFTITI